MSQTITNPVTMATRPDNDPTREGYAFDNWYTMATGGELFDFSRRPITASITVYARWLQQFTVTYHANKPSDAPQDATVTGVLENPVIISQGQTATPPTPPVLTGYNFVGWYTEEEASNQYNFSQVITVNIDLYAKWTTSQTVTVTYNVNKPSGSIDIVTDVPASVNVIINQMTTAPIPAPTLTNYKLAGWYTDEATTTEFVFSTEAVTANMVLYAKWRFRPETKAALVAEINRAITDATPSPNLNYIDTSQIRDMSALFGGKSSFNGNISSWNVSNVENMFFMFDNARAFNQNISSWNVAKVINMQGMFSDTRAFNQNISSWNVSKVTNMISMFSNAIVFNQNISSWNVAKVFNMASMFFGASNFNQNISSWNVDMVNSFSGFRDSSGLSDAHTPQKFR